MQYLQLATNAVQFQITRKLEFVASIAEFDFSVNRPVQLIRDYRFNRQLDSITLNCRLNDDDSILASEKAIFFA